MERTLFEPSRQPVR